MDEQKRQAKLAKLQALQDQYTKELSQRIAAIQNGWNALASPESRDKFDELHRLAHSLNGSAGSFGYFRLSQVAQELERALSSCLEIEPLLDHLRSIASAGPDMERPVEIARPPAKIVTDNPWLYVIEDDPLLAEEIATQLSAYGWKARIFNNATDAKKALRQQPPAAMIADVVLPEGMLAGAELLQQFQSLADQGIPRILISVRWDWEARLAAARAGADAYFVKPLDFVILTDALDKLIHRGDHQPYRVLIVEDTRELAEHYAEVLRAAGMEAWVVTEPSRLLDALATFKPELVLMDLYMPECSGVEIARVIRQDASYLAVPIVYLSTESARQRQLAALQIGADDFLEKPIADAYLVSAVTLRVARFRALAAMIRQDSMTGLLNHISFKLQLETELARSQRAASPLTFAMIDLDHFKEVNDRYGHPTGDRVIKSMAKLLGKRLRKSDVIGRYGGEEFAVIMPDTALDAGCAILDQLREQFSGIRQISGEKTFTCTFSAGVATTLPGGGASATMALLIQQADAALYEAKNRGRNQVRRAEPLT
ncbi:MAG: diguanylate cyclase [Candidatus Competibacter sp.]|nr:diguanylate cyclase [Candidatus Competibacter sp.]